MKSYCFFINNLGTITDGVILKWYGAIPGPERKRENLILTERYLLSLN